MLQMFLLHVTLVTEWRAHLHLWCKWLFLAMSKFNCLTSMLLSISQALLLLRLLQLITCRRPLMLLARLNCTQRRISRSLLHLLVHLESSWQWNLMCLDMTHHGAWTMRQYLPITLLMDTRVSILSASSAINTLMHISRMFLRQPLLLVLYRYYILVVIRLIMDVGTRTMRYISMWLAKYWLPLPSGKDSTIVWLI